MYRSVFTFVYCYLLPQLFIFVTLDGIVQVPSSEIEDAKKSFFHRLKPILDVQLGGGEVSKGSELEIDDLGNILQHFWKLWVKL